MTSTAKSQKVFRIYSLSGNSVKGDRSNFSKVVVKSFSRTREKVRKTWKKTGCTQDDFIRDCEEKFNKHYQNVQKLQKELRTFISKMRDIASQSKSLHETVMEIYEDNWICRSDCAESARRIDNSWIIYLETLTNLVQQPLEEYLLKFSSIRPKIDKRQRKSMDYDVARRKYETLLYKKVDSAKLEKARQDYVEAGDVYKNIASDLYEELPTFYDERLDFYCKNWSALFGANESLHHNITVLTKKIVESLHNLDHVKHEYITPKIPYDPEAPALGSLYKSVSMHSLNSYPSDSPTSSNVGVPINHPESQKMAFRTSGLSKTNSSAGYIPSVSGSNLLSSRQHYSQFDLSDSARVGASRAESMSAKVLDFRSPSRHKADSIDGRESQMSYIGDQLRQKSHTTVGRTNSFYTEQNNHRISEPSMELLFPKPSNSSPSHTIPNLSSPINGLENTSGLTKSPGSVSSSGSKRVIVPSAASAELPPESRVHSSPIHYSVPDNTSDVSSGKTSESFSTKPKSHSQPLHSEHYVVTSTPNNRYSSDHVDGRVTAGEVNDSLHRTRVTDRRSHHNGSLSSPSQTRNPLTTIAASPNMERQDEYSPEENKLLIVKFNYTAQDPDELSLSKGDILKITDWEDPELQEEGWLFGVRLKDNKRGLFPENHTTSYDMKLV